MARGRRPLAPEVHKLKGTYLVHPERENKLAPKADGDRPEPPDDFDEHEKRKWEQLCRVLETNGVLSSDLHEILVAYCTAYGGWMRAREAVRKIGMVIVAKSEKGTELKRNPFSVELHKYRETMNRLLPEFGLTPASRGKLVAKAGEEEADPVLMLLKRMKATRERSVG